MGLACEPPVYLFRNKFGLRLCQQRPPFRESQTQFRKTNVRALNDGQNSVALLDRVTLAVDQLCFDDQPHGLLLPLRERSAYSTRNRCRYRKHKRPP
jgi:hypothetical protein